MQLSALLAQINAILVSSRATNAQQMATLSVFRAVMAPSAQEMCALLGRNANLGITKSVHQAKFVIEIVNFVRKVHLEVQLMKNAKSIKTVHQDS
jgi:hypothetical protein